MRITVYDGSQTIGGSKIHVLEGENGLFLDFGMNFAKYSRYYEEFISERPSRGIHDLWRLDLIPKLNIYRADLIPADLFREVGMYPKVPINAVLISHAHLDHVGNVALLSKDVPLVGSPTTMIILKALKDTSRQSHMGMELPYYTPKSPSGENPFVLETDRKVRYYPSRDIVVTEELSNESREFLRWRANVELAKNPSRVKSIRAGRIEELNEADLGFNVLAYPVDHSIYGATAYIVEGDTMVAYTGDFRLHGKNGNHTRKFVKAARSASVLITEGTRVGRDEDINVSEEDVYNNALRIVEEAKGLVIADFSARNFERLESFKRIAERTGRELVVTTKDAYFLHALSLTEGENYLDGLRIYSSSKTKLDKWEEWIFIEYPELKVAPEELRGNQDNYILCFSFYDMPHLLDVMPDGGVYIYSSSEAFGEEQEFSFLRLWNWLQYFGFDVHGFQIDKNGHPIFEKGLHASGHISREELVEVIDEVDPDYIIPVHTENPEWFRENWGDKTILLNDGESWEA
ncbi:MBL fold metallo-hydrolase RNA specificity domain-containing protein [Thermococcus sp.]